MPRWVLLAAPSAHAAGTVVAWGHNYYGQTNVPAGGRICSVAVQPDGKMLVGGNFTTLGGQPRNPQTVIHRRS